MQEMTNITEKIPAVQPAVIRVAFKKTGSLQYISHLDLMRTMSRLVIRAGINVFYTEGFNPRPKLVFALPLSVGTESVCELLDIKLNPQTPDCAEILSKLRAQSTPELDFTDVYIPERKFKEIAYSEYEICINTKNSDVAELTDKINHLCDGSVIILKRTKTGESERDIKDLIKSLRACVTDGKIIINTILSADSEDYLNPEYIVKAIKAKFGVPSDDISPSGDSYSIKRMAVTDSNGEVFR